MSLGLVPQGRRNCRNYLSASAVIRLRARDLTNLRDVLGTTLRCPLGARLTKNTVLLPMATVGKLTSFITNRAGARIRARLDYIRLN